MPDDVIKRLHDATISLAEQFARDEGPVPGAHQYWIGRDNDPYCIVGHLMHRAGIRNFFDTPGYIRSLFSKVEEVNDTAPSEKRRKVLVPHLRTLAEKLKAYIPS